MTIVETLFMITCAVCFVNLIIFILFGQITVRKLRKNPETKEVLGVEFVSGWDIINVAQALALPNFVANKLKNSPLSALYADKDVLKKHTNRFDRILGTIFYVLFLPSGLTLIILAFLL
ncbi:MAG: hypothetical protein GY737_18585 [Desulfobacteraceae bacterium]|nr:hypothetical protein [Desulfobacteraceae bacterium]